MNVLFLDEVHPHLEAQLRSWGCSVWHDYESSTKQLIEKFQTIQIMVIRSRVPVDAEFLRSFPNLNCIARSGSGMENIDLEVASQLGVHCFSAPEANKNAVAEHALGMILSLFNRLPFADADVRAGHWNRELFRGEELMGKTVGLIGYGNNGSAFAEKLRSFGCTILAYDKYKTGFSNDFVQESTMDDLFQASDVLSLHIPQTPETLTLVNTEFISKFEKPFFLINTSRGKIVETKALAEALKSKKIKGACLDVLEYESKSFTKTVIQTPDFEYLINSKQVILSPHVAGWTHESYWRLSDVLAKKIKTILA
ncbi:MAG: NAD(P)-dependent oxidoreductase [Flavobacteriales bacterium]